MSLSCKCYDPSPDDVEWMYYFPDDFTTYNKQKQVKCCNCNSLIDKGSDCVEFKRFRYSESDAEDEFYGEDTEIPIPSWFMCEKCGDIYFNLTALGYCVSIEDNMQELLEEYVAEREYQRSKKK